MELHYRKSGLRPGPLLYRETPNQSTTPVEHLALTRCARQPPEFQPEFYIVIHLVSKSRQSLRPLYSCYSISYYRQTCTQTLARRSSHLLLIPSVPHTFHALLSTLSVADSPTTSSWHPMPQPLPTPIPAPSCDILT